MEISQVKEIVKKHVAEAVEICGTQAKLAERANLTQGAVGKYVRGEALPRGETAKRLSQAVQGKIQKACFAPHIFDFDDSTAE